MRIGMLSLVLIAVVTAGCSKSAEEIEREAAEANLAKLEQAARQEEYDRRKRARAGADSLKPRLRDPASFSGKAVVTGPGDTCYTYRARNGFGGLSAGRAILTVDGARPVDDNEDQFESLWQERCEGRGGQEVSLR
jgi:hypothetical protein